MIYDSGSMVSRSALLADIAKKPFVEISAADAGELGISDGDEVVVSAGDFEARLKAVVADIAAGAVFVPYDQPGLAANKLIAGVDPRVTVARA
jgi:NADH-quinone oxidoreductase subunit G